MVFRYIFFHQLIYLSYRRKYKNFLNFKNKLEIKQKAILAKLLGCSVGTRFASEKNIQSIDSYEKFIQELPITTYQDYESYIDLQKKNPKSKEFLNSSCDHYQPTSGSTGKRKWIPYTKVLKEEFEQAIGPWLYKLYQNYPNIKKGKHFWSLSWMPDNLRKEQFSLDELEVFPWWQKYLMKETMCIPKEITLAKDNDSALFATAVYLCCTKDLTLISVWSPLFLIQILDILKKNVKLIAELIEKSHWGTYQERLPNLTFPSVHSRNEKKRIMEILLNYNIEMGDQFFYEKLWPNLYLISCWKTGASSYYAERCRALFPKVAFQGKGLFATEGVVTIPIDDRYELAYLSHFYEFLNLRTGEVIPSWKLAPGLIVSPIISTGSGFFRYMLNDKIIIRDLNDGIPNMHFLGRNEDCDLTGEKMSSEIAHELKNYITQISHQSMNMISLVGVSEAHRPYYLVLLDQKNYQEFNDGDDKIDSEEFIELLDNKLRESFHYALARDLGQLDRIKIKSEHHIYQYYQSIFLKKGMVLGDIKVEILVQVPEAYL